MPIGLRDVEEGPDAESGEEPSTPPPVPAWLTHDREKEVPLIAEPPESRIVNFLKYCLHGILYSIVLFVVGIPWAFVGLLLAICGGIIGLVLVIVLGLGLMGWANSIVTGWLWFEVERGWGTYILHGLFLTIALALADVVPLVVLLLIPNPVAAAILAITMLPVFGFTAKAVASTWEVEPVASEPLYDASVEGP